MRIFRVLFILGAVALLASCATKFKTYNGPEVTRIVVFKGERRMHLFHNDQVLRSFDFELGFAPEGDKKIKGDGKTPEGRYRIDRRNPNSSFHLSIGIDYPNADDRAEAAALGKDPGGDIFIHGTPKKYRRTDDWTWGCISVTNAEIEDIYSMVKIGTVIDIYP